MTTRRIRGPLAALILGVSLVLGACNSGPYDQNETGAASAPANGPIAVEDIEFQETDFDSDLPERNGGIRCSDSRIVEANGTSYTLHSVAWAADGDESRASWFMAPMKPGSSSLEFSVSYPDSQVLVYSSPAIHEDWSVFLLDKNDRVDAMPTEMDYVPSQALRMVTLPIAPELTAELGQPIRMSATMNGQLLGECELQ